MVCMQWLLGGCTLLYGQYGMWRWTERCQSTEPRHTRHKRAIIKRHLISTYRNTHPCIRDTGKAFLFRSYHRSTQHRPGLTRNPERSNSGFYILANLIRRGL